MAYDKQFKLKIIESMNTGELSVGELAVMKNLPKQTIARWNSLYKKFGEEGLENGKPGTKEIPINHKFEELVINMWKKNERSVYKMRKDLKKEVRRNGYNISERQIRKIYKKNKLHSPD